MFPEILIIIILSGIFLVLVLSLIREKRQNRPEEESSYLDETDLEDDRTPCPLCGKKLHRGERVHSQIYSKGEDRLMNIYGCPWCYPAHPAGARKPERERRCPSCGLPMKESSFAVARVFERPGRKMHVHVLGCPVCRNSR
ncbi:MAG: hypothetical protein PQJ50_18305 [Spirochaetales bacterium]|nr:hypothetical protein [Spirochaetales bacterium]